MQYKYSAHQGLGNQCLQAVDQSDRGIQSKQKAISLVQGEAAGYSAYVAGLEERVQSQQMGKKGCGRLR